MTVGTNTTVDKDMGEARVRKLIGEMKRQSEGPHVNVGVLASSGPHKDAAGKPSGATVVQVAVWNEFGTGTIPERPAIRTGSKVIADAMAALGAALLGRLIDGTITLDRALDLLGLKAQAGLRKSIRDWTDPPNAPSTIMAKAREAGRQKISAAKAKGGPAAAALALAAYNNPLEDTGQYRNSIQYEKVK